MARKASRTDDATAAYVPRRRGRRRDPGEKPIQGYLNSPEAPRLREDLEEYLERHELSQTEFLRWVTAMVVYGKITPPGR